MLFLWLEVVGVTDPNEGPLLDLSDLLHKDLNVDR